MRWSGWAHGHGASLRQVADERIVTGKGSLLRNMQNHSLGDSAKKPDCSRVMVGTGFAWSCVQLPEMSWEPWGQPTLLITEELAAMVRMVLTTTKRPLSGGSAAGQSQIGAASGALGASMAASALALTLRLSPHERTNAIPAIAPAESNKIDLVTCM